MTVAVVVLVVVLSRRRDVVHPPAADRAWPFPGRSNRRRSQAPGSPAHHAVPFEPDPDYSAIPASQYLSEAAEAAHLRADAAGVPNVVLRRDRGQVVIALDTGLPVPALVNPASANLGHLGLFVFRPRALSLHEEAIRDADLRAPAGVILRRVPGDPENPTLIEVHAPPAEAADSAGPLLGVVDRETSAVLAAALDSGQHLAAVTLSGPRAGRFGTPITVLAARTEVLDALLLTVQ